MNDGLANRIKTLQQAFRRHLPADDSAMQSTAAPSVLVRAPGRVNLIGEHTDYNEGFVLPVAVDRDVIALGRRRRDERIRIYSVDFDQLAAFGVDDLTGPVAPVGSDITGGSSGEAASAHLDEAAPWSNYVRGVIWALLSSRHPVGGFDAAFAGNIPIGAGLSSSAALEVATALLVQQLFGLNVSPEVTAKLSQRAENEFIGVQCGIMDQFAVALSRREHGLLLDCRSLNYRFVPFANDDVGLIVADTNVRRSLVRSAYNERRTECEQGVQALHKYIPGIRALRDVTPVTFEQFAHRLPDPVRRRCQHVVWENARVLDVATALENNDFNTCGELMNESHDSLRDLFEVSSPELDTMVEIARGVPGVYGSRMTGAGFGGCTVSLVRTEAIPATIGALEAQYPRRTGKTPHVYVVRPSDGAGRVS